MERETTGVWETLMGILEVVKLKHKAACLVSVCCVPNTLQEYKRLRRHDPAPRILPKVPVAVAVVAAVVVVLIVVMGSIW